MAPKIDRVRLVDLAKLPKLVMLDPGVHNLYAPIYDIHNLFGGFVTDRLGKAKLAKGQRTRVETVKLASTAALDMMMARLLIAAAKRTRQYRVLTKKDEGFDDPAFWAKRESSHSSVWENYYFTIDGDPHEIGRLSFNDSDQYGVIIYSPGRVGAIKFNGQRPRMARS